MTNTTPSNLEVTNQAVDEPKIEIKYETKTEPISYEVEIRDDPTLAKGQTKILNEGRDGEREIVYRVEYEDGKEVHREAQSSTIVRSPVNEVILNGTYVAPSVSCPNGTYVNSADNTVCRPSATNTGGATAICKDGTYSYSQSRSGTCSHHGGVSRWL